MSSQTPSEVAVCLHLLSGLRKIREKWENGELDPGLSFRVCLLYSFQAARLSGVTLSREQGSGAGERCERHFKKLSIQ